MSKTPPNPETRIALFQRKEIRRTIHNNEWWFVITDVVPVLWQALTRRSLGKHLATDDAEKPDKRRSEHFLLIRRSH